MDRERMKIYLDVCCLNRPFDDLSQDRIRLEADAVLTILKRCGSGEWEIAASDAIDWELSKLQDLEKLKKVSSLYQYAHELLRITEPVKERARFFQENGIKNFDSLHLALAEINAYDALLTTDDNFLRAANRIGADIRVVNPIFWLIERS
jgi:hypothetical protein